MAREILAGSLLNEIAGSDRRWPGYQVLIWNPNQATINQVASDTVTVAPLDITPFVEAASFTENIGFENGDDPRTTTVSFNFRRHPNSGVNLRRGLIDDGVIVRVLQGDMRVKKKDWTPIFTGTFRGRPADDPGTRETSSEGMAAVAHGREERFLNLNITTIAFPQETDLGDIAVHIAQRHMGLGQNEILLGSQGYESNHLTNQIVELNALRSLWELLFPVGKKPKFDSRGRLVAVDVGLDKPAARIWRDDEVVVSLRAEPNDVEVNNSVVVKGLSSVLTRAIQQSKLLTEFSVVTGYFDDEYKEDKYYSEDHAQRAQDTWLATKKKIRWSEAEWHEADEFHGEVEIDTRYLRNIRVLIFVSWLATQIVVAIIDYYYHEGGIAADILNWITGGSIGTVRLILQLADLASMAALLWSMSFIGRGEYQIHGRPFDMVYQELVARHQLVSLEQPEYRELEFRNDFIDSMDRLDEIAAERLRREILKDQLFTLEVLDDALIEVDDIVELTDGSRYYVITVSKTMRRDQNPTMTLTCWKIRDGALRYIDAVSRVA